ncbi:MAG: hypothetical protein A2031_00855 [Deltaproteobacteria bacterium RBG_19FT_COMBO_43_11]|nr:MAG: hypothetical protein A2W27_12275 [Deltaproteobacteria bacterium RBG_16_44_11]OGP90666.1 MAG: hypothetical protein A2031_00855 [Deltaproteobacteria bacterium RBG_19FT_COMBO_43_11]
MESEISKLLATLHIDGLLSLFRIVCLWQRRIFSKTARRVSLDKALKAEDIRAIRSVFCPRFSLLAFAGIVFGPFIQFRCSYTYQNKYIFLSLILSTFLENIFALKTGMFFLLVNLSEIDFKVTAVVNKSDSTDDIKERLRRLQNINY